MKKKRVALISVYHKEGIEDFARQLVGLGFQIYSSGGTARHLKSAGIEVTDVSELVGGGAILGHRVVTLSREVHAGLLATESEADLAELEDLGIPFIDLVCVDLYPLQEEIARTGSDLKSVIEQTDIGGPTMLRSAAKGCRLVICDPEDRQRVIEYLNDGETDDCLREELCAKAEAVIAKYCLASAAYRGGDSYRGIIGRKVGSCKYGENAHQQPAGFYSVDSADPLSLDRFVVDPDSNPSFNTWCDVDRALQTMTHIAAVHEANYGRVPLIAVGVKHGNPCGAAVGWSEYHVLKRMMDGDKLAIFGGVIMTNFVIGENVALALDGKMLAAIICPSFNDLVVERFRQKKSCCLAENPVLAHLGVSRLDQAPRFRYVRGGFLQQPNYTFVLRLLDERLQKLIVATNQEEEDLLLAWAIGSTSNSNTITLVKDDQLIGNGVGQQDRVGAAELAIARARRAGHDVVGAVAYSDSFFPFDDGPKVLADAGIKAILSSSGSKNDKDTIKLCQERGVALYLIPDAVGRGFCAH